MFHICFHSGSAFINPHCPADRKTKCGSVRRCRNGYCRTARPDLICGEIHGHHVPGPDLTGHGCGVYLCNQVWYDRRQYRVRRVQDRNQSRRLCIFRSFSWRPCRICTGVCSYRLGIRRLRLRRQAGSPERVCHERYPHHVLLCTAGCIYSNSCTAVFL